jgi:hypothetical protein
MPSRTPRAGGGERLAHRHQRHHAGSGVERLQDRHAAADEDRERRREARRVQVAQQAPDHRAAPEEAMDRGARPGTLERDAQGHREHHGERDPQPPRRLEEIRQRDQRAREDRQLLVRVLEDLHHLRQHVDEERADDGERDHGHDRRVDERERQPRAHLLAVLEVVRELRQHPRQLPRRFARGDERAIELAEDVRKRAQGLGHRVAGDHLAAQRRQHLARALVLGLLDERVERLLDGEPGLEQRGEPRA